MCGDGTLWPLVHVQLENVRSRIMAYHIEIILAADDLRAIDLGGQDHLIFRVRSRKKIAERIDDAAAAARNYRFGIGTINCIVIPGKSRRRLNWLQESTKQRPSTAMCRIDAPQESRPSAVGAQ